MEEDIANYALEITAGLHNTLDNENFMEDQFGNGFKYIKNELNLIDGCIKGEVPGAAFKVGEFVSRKGSELVQVNHRSYTESRGWVYGITYASVNKETQTLNASGGASCWWNEDEFKKIDDPLLLLIIKKYFLTKEKDDLKRQLINAEKQLDKLAYSLNVVKGI
ncbi:hypothetical protein [Terribacillus sp. DMT04]|uniref:hypothetical protein n=1 Tax=Terribacillus sp. DMT04 TaxID=2850441 RepID=UPI001C2BBB27|nr:hypothetical protein [Terribacillus sp. DMT04]QXE02799.1 hypothetical protein KS242_06360 [Terribacillus sp. DMT04]